MVWGFFGPILFGTSTLPGSGGLFLQVRAGFSHYFFKYIFCPLHSLFSSWDSYNANVFLLDVVFHKFLKLSSLFFSLLFPFCCSDWVKFLCLAFKFTDLFFYFISSVVEHPLVYFSVQLFYSSVPWPVPGTFLYFLSCLWSSHCVHSFFLIITITLNSLSSKLLISFKTFSEIFILFFHLELIP